MAWALDVKKADVEALAKWEEKELFKEFVEEFNTGGLPHRKYYDLDAYEASKARKEHEKAAARAAARAGTRKAAEQSDEQELHRRRVEERRREQEQRVRDAMEAMRCVFAEGGFFGL
jgi:23S rRNA G2069 N7-methylase RlmK/C1962 C5-methylase RlmI